MHANTWNSALGMLVLVLTASLLIQFLPVQDPLAISLEQRLLPPGSGTLLGTDELGRDMASRIVHGVSLTVSSSVLALLGSLAIGIPLGVVAGYYYKRWPDRAFNWIADLIVSVPFLVLIAAILAVTGPGLAKAYLVLTLVIWVAPARIVRAEVIKTMSLTYVVAERAAGSSERRTLSFVVLPTCLNTAVILSVSYLPDVIALEAGLSFLGLGVQPPAPGLGKMVFDGLGYLSSAPWMSLGPVGAIFVIVLVARISVGWLGKGVKSFRSGFIALTGRGVEPLTQHPVENSSHGQ